MSFQDFEARYSDKRYEYVDGRPLPRGPEVLNERGERDVPPKPLLELVISTRVAFLVGKHVLDNRLGVPLVSGVGFFMTQEPPELREADFGFLPPERAGKVKIGDWLPFPPDFAVEIVTKWDSEDYVRRKVGGYLANGTRLLWVIHPEMQTVDVYRPGEGMLTLSRSDTLEDNEVVRGLRVPVKDLFEIM